MIQNFYKQFRGALYMELNGLKIKKLLLTLKILIINILSLAVLHPANRVFIYIQYKNELNFNAISFPIKISDISKIEKVNNLALKIFRN